MCKNIILGAIFLLSGTIGFVGWANACVLCGGNFTYVFSYMSLGSNSVITFIFAIFIIVGITLLVLSLFKQSSKQK